MFDGQTLENYAEVLLWGLDKARKQSFARNSLVLVRFDAPALPLAEALQRRILERGLIPVLRMLSTPRMEHAFYTLADESRLTTILPGEQELHQHLAGAITLIAPESLSHLACIAPDVLATAQRARRPLQDIAREREDKGEYAWTLCIWPTLALAEQAGMTLSEYAREVAHACRLDEADPVSGWKEIAREADALKAALDALGNATLCVESADGTDLGIAIGECRKWAGITGRNIPSFELYVSPDWRTASGKFRADLPSFRSGNIIKDVLLEFRAGEVVHAGAARGEAFLLEQVKLDAGASRIGEFALVDRRFSPIGRFMANTLYDENHGGPNGSMHIALGQSYANTFAGAPAVFTTEERVRLGFNASMLHWDMVATTPRRVTARMATGKQVTVFEDGEFRLL